AMELVLNSFTQQFNVKFPKMMQAKLGLSSDYNEDFQDELITLLTTSGTDMTIFYRNLGNILKSDTPEITYNTIEIAFYEPSKINATLKTSWFNWMESYLEQLNAETNSDEQRKKAMNLVNPKYVLRNYMAQLAIEAAEKEDYSLINELYILLKQPYDEQPE